MILVTIRNKKIINLFTLKGDSWFRYNYTSFSEQYFLNYWQWFFKNILFYLCVSKAGHKMVISREVKSSDSINFLTPIVF